jgi:hypothetical protein
MAADVWKIRKLDVHITKTNRRERIGADDIHNESYGRRTLQWRYNATTQNWKTLEINEL